MHVSYGNLLLVSESNHSIDHFGSFQRGRLESVQTFYHNFKHVLTLCAFVIQGSPTTERDRSGTDSALTSSKDSHTLYTIICWKEYENSEKFENKIRNLDRTVSNRERVRAKLKRRKIKQTAKGSH